MGVNNKDNCTSSPVSILWANKMKIAVPNSSQKAGTKMSMTGSKSSNNPKEKEKKVCLCAPTTHLGSFKCRHHRSIPSSSSSSSSKDKDKDDKFDRNITTKQSHKTGLSRFGRSATVVTSEHEFPTESP